MRPRTAGRQAAVGTGFQRGVGLAALALLLAAPGRTMPAARGAAAAADDFFIVSSIDAARNRIVLKRPTETTLTMRVTDHTTFRSESGKPLKLTDLRAGDTVFIISSSGAAGELTALAVRQGPMTVAELQRRYLKPAALRRQ